MAALLAAEIFDVRHRVVAGHGDWLVYWTAARHMLGAADPYTIAAPTDNYYIYPPLFALLLRPLASLRAEDAAVVWYLLNVSMLFGCYFEWRRIFDAMRTVPPPRWLVIATAAALSLPVVSTVQGGQTGIAILYFTLLGTRLVLFDERAAAWIAAGFALALPAAIKLAPGLVGAVTAVQLLAGDLRRRGIVFAASFLAGLAAWLLAVPAILAGWDRNLVLLRSFLDRVVVSHVNMNTWSETNQGVVRLVGHYGELLRWPEPVIAGVALLCALAFGVPVLLAMRRYARSGSALDRVLVTSLAAAASLFYSPVTWHVHYTLALPFLGTAPLRLLDRGRPHAARGLTLAITASFLLQALLNALKLTAFPLLGQLFAVCVVVFVRLDRATAA